MFERLDRMTKEAASRPTYNTNNARINIIVRENNKDRYCQDEAYTKICTLVNR